MLSPDCTGELFERRAACADVARWSCGTLTSSQVRDLHNVSLSVGGLRPIKSMMSGTVTSVKVGYHASAARSRIHALCCCVGAPARAAVGNVMLFRRTENQRTTT